MHLCLKKDFLLQKKNQVRAVISFLESKKYPLLLGAKEEIILKRSEKKIYKITSYKTFGFYAINIKNLFNI